MLTPVEQVAWQRRLQASFEAQMDRYRRIVEHGTSADPNSSVGDIDAPDGPAPDDIAWSDFRDLGESNRQSSTIQTMLGSWTLMDPELTRQRTDLCTMITVLQGVQGAHSGDELCMPDGSDPAIAYHAAALNFRLNEFQWRVVIDRPNFAWYFGKEELFDQLDAPGQETTGEEIAAFIESAVALQLESGSAATWPYRTTSIGDPTISVAAAYNNLPSAPKAEQLEVLTSFADEQSPPVQTRPQLTLAHDADRDQARARPVGRLTVLVRFAQMLLNGQRPSSYKELGRVIRSERNVEQAAALHRRWNDPSRSTPHRSHSRTARPTRTVSGPTTTDEPIATVADLAARRADRRLSDHSKPERPTRGRGVASPSLTPIFGGSFSDRQNSTDSQGSDTQRSNVRPLRLVRDTPDTDGRGPERPGGFDL